MRRTVGRRRSGRRQQRTRRTSTSGAPAVQPAQPQRRRSGGGRAGRPFCTLRPLPHASWSGSGGVFAHAAPTAQALARAGAAANRPVRSRLASPTSPRPGRPREAATSSPNAVSLRGRPPRAPRRSAAQVQALEVVRDGRARVGARRERGGQPLRLLHPQLVRHPRSRQLLGQGAQLGLALHLFNDLHSRTNESGQKWGARGPRGSKGASRLSVPEQLRRHTRQQRQPAAAAA